MKFYTFKRDALAHKAAWQVLRFTPGKGYWLFGDPPKQPITMYDSVNVHEIPASAEAVAGYVGGMWPTYNTLALQFPKAHKLSIAVRASQDAECLDVEQGDATNDQAAAWVKRQKSLGVKKPVVYTFLANVPALLRALEKGGVKRTDIRLWTAHWTFKPHRCSSKCGLGMTTTADATQYNDRALGKNLDVSLCSPTFFG